MRTLLAGLVLAIALAQPVAAQPVCTFTLETTLPQLVEKSVEHVVLSEAERVLFLEQLESAAEAKFGQRPDLSVVTDVLLATLQGQLFFGLVIDGCLTSPEPLSKYLPAGNQSGYTPTGVHA